MTQSTYSIAQSMHKLVQKAKKNGFSPVLNNTGKTIKTSTCQSCGKDRLVLFTHPSGSKISACPCGMRELLTKTSSKQCKATTKSGSRCKNKAMNGSDYCDLHHKQLAIKAEQENESRYETPWDWGEN